MSMDIYALHENLNKIHPCRPPRGKHYIDNYLKAAYLGDEDMMKWIQENWQSYAYRHIHGLLTQTLSSVLSNKKFREAINIIDSLYEVENKDNPNKLSNLLSQRLKEEKKFSNIIKGKFRR